MRLYLARRTFCLTSSSTKDWNQAHEWSKVDLSNQSTFETYCPKSVFHLAHKSDHAFSFTIREANGETFTFGLGVNPTIPETSNGVAIDRGETFQGISDYELRADWDSYEIDTSSFTEEVKEVSLSDEDIHRLLTKNAPNSSVWPGDPELICWMGERENQSLVCVGALVRWRSQRVMLVSIATDEAHRGKGFAQLLVRKSLCKAHSLGIDRVGLGVVASNAPAKAVYERLGFRLIREFSRYAIRTDSCN